MKIKLKNVSLNYECHGNGEPLILLHGNGESSEIFKQLSKQLSKKYQVFAIDSRNHGQSDKHPDFSYQAMVEDVQEFIEQLNLSAVNIVGFSDGAIIALMLSLQTSNIIKKMALLGVNLKPKDFLPEILSELDAVYRKYQDPLIKLMLTEPQINASELQVLQQPVLVVFGEHDLFKTTLVDELRENLSNSEIVILSKQTHDSYVTNTDYLSPILLEFLKDS